MESAPGQQERHFDVALALVCAAIITVELLLWPGRRFAVADVAGGLVATLPLALRRRRPLTGFVLVMAGIAGTFSLVGPDWDDESINEAWTVLPLSLSLFGVAALALFSVGAHAAIRYFWVSIGAIVLVSLTFATFVSYLEDRESFRVGDVIGIASGFVFQCLVPWVGGLALGSHRRRKSEAERLTRLLSEEEARNVEAVEQERARIARELHDVVSHALTVTLFQARGGRRLQAVDPSAAREAFDVIERTNTEALGDMRRMLNVLRAAEVDEVASSLSTTQRLPQLVADVRGSGIAVSLTLRGDLERAPAVVDLSVYRIVQEALTNVIKHSGTGTAEVSVDAMDDHVDVLVVNDGPRLSPQQVRGQGLSGIRERVSVLGGEVDAGPGPSSGYVVRVRLPYAAGPA